MTRLLCVEGRLPWALVIAIMYIALSVLIGDYVWRSFVMPFEAFLLYGLVIETVGIGFCWIMLRRYARRER